MHVFVRFLRLLLFPLAIVYDAITRTRNHLYNSGYKPSIQFNVFTVCVGNLNVGGAGKTPMVEYLIRLLHTDYKIATLSRGYGRGTRGFRLATTDDNARTVGDEPFQMFRKFADSISVAVGEERALAIPTILHEIPDTNLILLDDAFQHRTVRPHFSILLTEYGQPFYTDFLLPTGNLREARRGASRADVVVVTKCPDRLDHTEQAEIIRKVKHYAGEKPVYFSRISYGEPIAFGAESTIKNSIVLVSGIAHESSLKTYLQTHYTIVDEFNFPDHHSYLEKEFDEIIACSNLRNCSVLTTEKDMVRLLDSKFDKHIKVASLFYLPIRMEFVENGPEFDTLMRQNIHIIAD